ncbi:hypothetical protein BU23DRAFT_194705 [Bimuria novae-zelandiae CBS 107.79]|uniref:Uncharacterized protein n=1 Tax=Bimuria novae-zelandiae CBS 107.79 TaxID=1447943 RepID=A0A6A5V113_9PLEO|nr:hypothetical protein BU23DRAFT_194705 [Bimuria novae-zelandiae CBS 107.79]
MVAHAANKNSHFHNIYLLTDTAFERWQHIVNGSTESNHSSSLVYDFPFFVDLVQEQGILKAGIRRCRGEDLKLCSNYLGVDLRRRRGIFRRWYRRPLSFPKCPVSIPMLKIEVNKGRAHILLCLQGNKVEKMPMMTKGLNGEGIWMVYSERRGAYLSD